MSSTECSEGMSAKWYLIRATGTHTHTHTHTHAHTHTHTHTHMHTHTPTGTHTHTGTHACQDRISSHRISSHPHSQANRPLSQGTRGSGTPRGRYAAQWIAAQYSREYSAGPRSGSSGGGGGANRTAACRDSCSDVQPRARHAACGVRSQQRAEVDPRAAGLQDRVDDLEVLDDVPEGTALRAYSQYSMYCLQDSNNAPQCDRQQHRPEPNVRAHADRQGCDATRKRIPTAEPQWRAALCVARGVARHEKSVSAHSLESTDGYSEAQQHATRSPCECTISAEGSAERRLLGAVYKEARDHRVPRVGLLAVHLHRSVRVPKKASTIDEPLPPLPLWQ